MRDKVTKKRRCYLDKGKRDAKIGKKERISSEVEIGS
jgi:hypothetical protein